MSKSCYPQQEYGLTQRFRKPERAEFREAEENEKN